jgi:hypothetical protein
MKPVVAGWKSRSPTPAWMMYLRRSSRRLAEYCACDFCVLHWLHLMLEDVSMAPSGCVWEDDYSAGSLTVPVCLSW